MGLNNISLVSKHLAAKKLPLTNSAKLVLFKLAEHCNEGSKTKKPTWLCNPSVNTLQKETGLHVRTVRYCIKELVSAGLVTPYQEKHRTPNHYRLNIPGIGSLARLNDKFDLSAHMREAVAGHKKYMTNEARRRLKSAKAHSKQDEAAVTAEVKILELERTVKDLEHDVAKKDAEIASLKEQLEEKSDYPPQAKGVTTPPKKQPLGGDRATSQGVTTPPNILATAPPQRNCIKETEKNPRLPVPVASLPAGALDGDDEEMYDEDDDMNPLQPVVSSPGSTKGEKLARLRKRIAKHDLKLVEVSDRASRIAELRKQVELHGEASLRNNNDD